MASSCSKTPTPGDVPRSTAPSTGSPAPAAAAPADCSDGAFARPEQDGKPLPMLQLMDRTYEPGRTYHLCFVVPDDASAPGRALTLESVNASNTSCNVFVARIASPTGKPYEIPGAIAPGVAMLFERGTWSFDLRLDANAETLCVKNKPLDMTLTWF